MNTPRNKPVINPDDPKWTAYVLGELDEVERLEIERLLETSEEARALVEDLTIATSSMKEELSSLMPLMMSPEQRAAIRSAAEPKPRRWVEMFPAKWGLGLAAAAAVLLVAFALPMPWNTVPNGATSPSGTAEKGDATASSQQSEGAESRRVEPAVLPKVSVVTKDLKEKPSVSAPVQPGNNQPGAATAAPVLTAEEFAVLAQGAAPAQVASQSVSTGSLKGTVQDSSKALIPGVTITATNATTGAVANAVTNESGAFSLPSVVPGPYNVTATLPGFQTQTVTNLPVGPRDEARVDYTLQVAGVNTQVEVSVSASSVLNTSGASVGQVLSEQRVSNLPSVGNNVLDLISVMKQVPAATPPPPAPAVSRPPARPQDIETQLGKLQQGQQEDKKAEIAGAQRQPANEQGQPGTAAAGRGGRGAAGAGGGGGRGGGGRAGGAAPVQGGAAATPPQETTFSGLRADGFSNVRDGITVSESRERVGAPPVPPPPPPPPPSALFTGGIVNRINAPGPNTETYDRVADNPFIRTTQENLATFSIDVDTASYANVRRFLTQNQIPPRDAVRIEELVNYFNYDYAQPTGNAPIAPNMEVAAAPWNPVNRLVRIGIKAREVNANRRPPSNLVFLIDVSGSMNSPEKLPLVKAGLSMLVERLGENDSVSIVVYAGASGLVLPPTSGLRKESIRQAIDSLQPGGSTNGASGIQLAYNQATANFLRSGSNRVILMTDGDFNVGVTNQGDLTRLIEQRAKSGVFLSVLGFGMGNYKDSTLEKLADQGNGHYAYIDNITEARKVLVEEMSGTLVTVAKDVKIQVDFNPSRVEAYRLIGYENRVLRTEDFNNDAKDAGDMGAGHTVTALFEVVPKGGEVPGPSIDPSKYTQPQGRVEPAPQPNAAANSNEMLTLRVRYKLPTSDTSTRMDVPLVDRGATFARATTDFRFAASVAEFGMILRDSPYRGTSRMDGVLDIAEGSIGQDRNGYRREFVSLVQRARNLRR